MHLFLLLLVGPTSLYVFRAVDGFETLAGLMTGGKEHDKAQTHLVLELISAAVRVDGGCKAALAEKPDILKSISSLLAFEQVSLLHHEVHRNRYASSPAPLCVHTISSAPECSSKLSHAWVLRQHGRVPCG